MPPKLVVCGPKKCGKTTLIRELIPRLRSHGLRVATAKHSPHPHLLDKPGSDTDVHRRAGATASALITPSGCAIFTGTADDLEDFLDRHLGDADLILVEGLGGSKWPKLLLFPSKDPTYLAQIDLASVRAVIQAPNNRTPGGLRPDVRRFTPQEVDGIARWILQDILGSSSTKRRE